MAAKPVWTHLHAALDVFGEAIADNIRRILRVDRSIATKKTQNSIQHKVEGETITFYAEEAINSEYTVLDFIDKGRKAGKKGPPIDAIKEWMKAKRIQPKKNGRFVKKSEKNLRDSAFLISRSIASKGIPPKDTIGRAVSQIEKRMVDGLLEAYSRDVEEFIEANRK